MDAPPDVASLPLERLESDICTLAGHLAAATCRWLVLVGEFDRRQGWASWGARSCGQWLSWRCGMGGGTAREHVRVGRALLELAREHLLEVTQAEAFAPIYVRLAYQPA